MSQDRGGTVIVVELIGVPSVTGARGEDLTPKGAHARAVLAILALSPRKKANRRWLEALLWPDRAPEQASGSLRQVLSAIRRQFGEYSEILLANRLDVGLDLERIQVDVLDTLAAALTKLKIGHQFLEGIDIRSDVFEDWLRQERATLRAKVEASEAITERRATLPGLTGDVPANAVPILYTERLGSNAALENFFVDTICAQLAQTATAHSRAEVRFLDGLSAPAILSPGARCGIRVMRQGNGYVAMARLTQEPQGSILWMRQVAFNGEKQDEAIDAAASLALEATEAFAAANSAATNAQKANALAFEALEDIFSFDPERLAASITKLADANRLDAHAPRPALQALALAFQALEDTNVDREKLCEDVLPLVDESMLLDSRNALALSFLADVHDLVFDDPQTAIGFAECALRSNPGIGYAYASLGAFELRRGNLGKARSAAQRAQRQLSNTSLEVFSLMRLCVTSMNVGELAEATQAAEKAAALAPLSRPPLRHLYALRLAQGDRNGARDALRALRRLEPDFSLRRIREDPEFPGPSLRRMGFDQLQDVDL